MTTPAAITTTTTTATNTTISTTTLLLLLLIITRITAQFKEEMRTHYHYLRHLRHRHSLVVHNLAGMSFTRHLQVDIEGGKQEKVATILQLSKFRYLRKRRGTRNKRKKN